MSNKNPDYEMIKEKRRLGAFISSLNLDEIEGIKKILLASLIEYERIKENAETFKAK